MGIFIALVVGIFTWRLAVAFGADSSPLGKVTWRELFLFYAPMVGTLFPVTLGLIDRGANVLVAWIGALAPVLGLLNVVFSGFIAITLFRSGPAVSIAILVLGALWLIPLIFMALNQPEEQI